jgi:hypothetical protein
MGRKSPRTQQLHADRFKLIDIGDLGRRGTLDAL